MRIRLKGINVVRKRLADGSMRTYYYAWKGGPALRGEPGTPEFVASYNEAVARKVAPPRGTLLTVLQAIRPARISAGSLAARGRSYVALIKRIEKRFRRLPAVGADRSPYPRRLHGVARSDCRRQLAATSRLCVDGARARVCHGAVDRGLVAAIRASAAVGSIAARARQDLDRGRRGGLPSIALRRICTCRCCSRYGPGSGKAICCGLPWSAYDGNAYPLAASRRPGRASSSRSALRSRPRSMPRRSAARSS